MPTIPAKLGFVRFSRGQPVTESNPSKVFAAIALMIGTGSGCAVNKKNRVWSLPYHAPCKTSFPDFWSCFSCDAIRQ